MRLEDVRRGNLVRTVSAPGLVEPKTEVQISAQVSARIVALPFDEGDLVRAGDVVVRLDARDLAAQLDSAKAQLKSEEARLEGARAAFATASIEYNRRKELFSTKDISKADLERAQAEYDRAESQLRVAEFAIEIARANISRAEKDLDNAVITAPFDGVLVKRHAEVGELVVVGTLNNPGSVILEIADLSKMLVLAKVDETNIAPVRAGQKARAYLSAFGEKAVPATVTQVTLQRQLDRDGTAYFEVELSLDDTLGERVHWGLTANLNIKIETLEDVLLVPSQAIQDRVVDELPEAVRNGGRYIDPNKRFARVVYTVRDGKAVTVPVDVGPSDLVKTAVLGGLEEGQQVVVGPFRALADLKHDKAIVREGEKKDDAPPAATADAAGEKSGGA